MLRSTNEDTSKEKENQKIPKTKTKHSVLNVNATEFVPSNNAQRPNAANYQPRTVMANQMQNSEVRPNVTIDDRAAFAQSQYAQSNYVSVDQTNYQTFCIGCEAGNNGGPPLLAQGYTPLCCLSEEHRQDEAATILGPQYANSPYSSYIGPMRNIQFVAGCTPNMCAISPQRPVYSLSPNVPIPPQMQNYDGRCYDINCNEAAYSQRHHYSSNEVYSSVNPTQFYNGGYQTRENGIPMYQGQDSALTPHTNEFLSSNQESTYPRYPGSDRTMSPGIDWDFPPEPKQKIEMNVTTSLLPEVNSLVLNTDPSTSHFLEAVWYAPVAPTVVLTVDTDHTNTLKVISKEIIDYSVESAATPGNNAREEAQPLPGTNPETSQEQQQSRNANVVCSDKEQYNIVLIGQADVGKSTLCRQIMLMTMVDKKIIEKFDMNAKKIKKYRKNLLFSWPSWLEKRDGGKTMKTGRGYFETPLRHYTILDAPGQTDFIHSMISAAAQADIAVLVLSARGNEFETGFEKGGQTREHIMLARSAGLNITIALVNKMDDPSVEWKKERFDYCRTSTLPFLKKLGYIPKTVQFLPVSGLTGQGLVTAVSKGTCPWYEGPSFIECLEALGSIQRRVDSPFVMPISEKFKDMGTVVMGKVETGFIRSSSSLLVMPNKVPVTIDKIWSGEQSVSMVKTGENVKMRLKGNIKDNDISMGSVLCEINIPISTAKVFDARLHILNYKSFIKRGFQAVMHIQSLVSEITIAYLFCLINPRTKERIKMHNLQYAKKNETVIARIYCSEVICVSVFREYIPLGRFTLRLENKAIAVGKVLRIIE